MLITALVLLAAQGAALDPQPEVGSLTTTFLTLTEADIVGATDGPTGSLAVAPPKAHRRNLIGLRANFRAELARSSASRTP